MSETIVIVQRVEDPVGNRPYKVIDGNGRDYATFKDELGSAAKGFVGKQAKIIYSEKTTDKNGRTFTNRYLDGIEQANGSSVPAEYSHQRPDGEADWDKVALGKTRCALWEGYLSGGLAASIYAKASVADGVDAVDTVLRKGKMLIVALEKDVFERAPGDDDVPF